MVLDGHETDKDAIHAILLSLHFISGKGSYFNIIWLAIRAHTRTNVYFRNHIPLGHNFRPVFVINTYPSVEKATHSVTLFASAWVTVFRSKCAFIWPDSLSTPFLSVACFDHKPPN